MPTLLEFFHHDFNGPSFDKTIVFSRETIENRAAKNLGEIIEIQQRLLQDSNSLVKLFTFYIPGSSATLMVCKSLVFELEKLKWEAEEAAFAEQFQEDPLGSKNESIYSKRVFMYSELPLSPVEFTELDNLCRSMDLVLAFRTEDYRQTMTANIKPLAFIAHDKKDKNSIARCIAHGLHSRLCYTGYEQYSLQSGDELQESIENGLKDGMRCILVISPDFLVDMAGSKREFNLIFTKERLYNERIVLPIWSNVTKEQVCGYSPSLADAFALIWPSTEGKSPDEFKREVEILISRLHIQIVSMDGFHRFR